VSVSTLYFTYLRSLYFIHISSCSLYQRCVQATDGLRLSATGGKY